MSEETLVQITTRIEGTVAEQLAELAQKERRSLSAQLAWIIERFIEAERAKTEFPCAGV